jgi:hypothetical protein
MTYKRNPTMHKKQKTEKKMVFLSFLGSMFFCKCLILFVLVSKAQAGGYDEPIPPTTSPSLAAPNEQLPVLSLLNWDKWEKPYWLNNNICRESKGNIICFSPKVTRQIRWKIPLRNESVNPN